MQLAENLPKITWIRPTNVCAIPNYFASIRVYEKRASIALPSATLDHLRWRVGDRVEIGFIDSAIYLRLSTSRSAYKIYGNGRRKDGSYSSSRLEFSPPEGFPLIPGAVVAVDEKDAIKTGDMLGLVIA